jgi:transcriptional regulator GlxA family with amidase domain
MVRAAQLLRDNTLPVSTVARAVGYRQAAQFSKAFRRHYGQPPSAVRRTLPPQRVAA